MKIEIKNRRDGKVILCGEYEGFKDCLQKNRTVNLAGANLYGADLARAKNYVSSHDIFIQLIRNNLIKFTRPQQDIACRIFSLRLCWDTIKKEYGRKAIPVFARLRKLGWGEYADKYAKALQGEG